ncbi:MAG TPA: hypothetical protein VFA57_20290 [Pseudolabrys sp.]|nr:hypothetical protein [Pseudolabrys sp.]
MKQLFAAILLLTVLLFGATAASAEDELLSKFLVAPGKYVLFNCQQLDVQAKANETRMRELEGLMAKSGSELVNAVTYRPEYLQLRGELADIRHEAADKKCKAVPGARPQRRGAVLR